MPLLDHFHPPVSNRRDWEDFHGTWASEIKARFNERILGPEYFAQMTVHVGRSIEVDIATLHDSDAEHEPSFNGSGGGGMALATAPAWAPPTVELEAPAVFPDDFEVRVYSTTAGRVLVGAIELVSPANKDRPETRRAFAAKVVSYLSRKVGVVVVDIVTNRQHNLHDEVCELFGLGPPYPFDPDPVTYAVSYRPVRRPDGDRIEMWRYPLTIGGGLPVLPLGLRNAGIVPVDLDATYNETCVRSRLANYSPV